MTYARRRPRSMRSARGNNSPAPPPSTAPKVTSFSPAAGKVGGGEMVTVFGSNFAAGMTAPLTGGGTLGVVTLDGVTPSSKCTIVTGAHASGAVTWHLANTDGGVSSNQSFTYLAAPVVSAISPNHGPATLSNTSRTVTCSGLPPIGSGVTLTATVGGNAVTSIVNNGNGTFTCTVPTHAAGVVDVIVTVDGVASSGGTGLYTFDAVPTITSFTFTSAAGGNTFGIGTGFLSGMSISVLINGTPTALTSVVVSNGGTQVSATLPTPGPYTAGNWNVTVTNPDTQAATLASGFTVFAPPTIAGLMWDLDFNAGTTVVGGFLTAVTEQSSNGYVFNQVAGSSLTYTASALNGYPAVTGNGSTGLLLSATNITHATKSATAFFVMKVDAASSNATVIFEQTNNSKSSAAVNGYRVEYLAAGPQLDVSSGTSSGASLNETYAITGVALNNGYAAYCFVFDRAAAYPITIIGGTPVYEQTNIGAALAGQNLVTDGSSASNYDTAPLSIFARNVAGAASAASKVSIVRAFAYNTALSQATRQNVMSALASQYGTDTSPATGQLLVVGDSISSVYDTAGSYSWSSFIYATQFYDNLQSDIPAVKGWTATNANTNRVALLTPRRSDIPCDLVYWLGTNDMGDTNTPGDIWTNFIQPFLNYANGLTSPSFRNKAVATIDPRATPLTGTGATFEAKREGKDTSGAALPAYANGHAYSSATPDWVLVNDGSGNPNVFRCTTGGTSSTASPSWSFTIGATTTAGGGVVFTCYGRPINAYIRDPSNQATYGYSVIDVGDPATVLGTYASTSNPAIYPDGIHPSAVYQTGQANPSAPSGPPVAGSVLSYFVPLLKQGGTWTRTYRPPQIAAAIGLQSGTPNVAKGSPFYITGQDFGELDATHPLTVSDGVTSFDCTSVVRVSDVKVTAIAPVGIGVGGPYAATYKRTDGQTATGGSIIIIPQPAITGVAMGNLSSASAETLPATTLNPLTINIYVNNGGGFGASAATFNGVSLTSVAYNADGSIVTGTLPVGSYTPGTGNVTVTSPSSPTALTNGAIFAATLDPSSIWSSTVLRGWYRGDSVQGSGTATSWTDKGTVGNNLGSIGGAPTINTASAVFLQNGTGIKTVTLNGTSDRFLRPNPTFSMGGSTPVPCTILAIMQFGATSSNNGRLARYSTTGGALGIGTVASATKKPVLDVTWTSTWPTAFTAPFTYYGHCNGVGGAGSTGGLSANDATEQTGAGTMTGGGIISTGLFAIGYDAGSAFCGGEVSEVATVNKEITATEARQYAIYAANYHGVTI